MKRLILWSLLAVVMFLSACSEENEDFSNFERLLPSYEWKLNGYTFKFYRNGLFTYEDHATKTATGAMTWYDYMAAGSWSVNGNILTLTNKTANYNDEDGKPYYAIKTDVFKDLIYDSESKDLNFNTSSGSSSHFDKSSQRDDKTDKTAHDSVLTGTWLSNQEYKDSNGVIHKIQMALDGKGNASFNFVESSGQSSYKETVTNYSTCNGVVSFSGFFTQYKDMIYIASESYMTFYASSGFMYTCYSWVKE